MRRHGIRHAELAEKIAGLRHEDSILISDAGSASPALHVVDLAVADGNWVPDEMAPPRKERRARPVAAKLVPRNRDSTACSKVPQQTGVPRA